MSAIKNILLDSNSFIYLLNNAEKGKRLISEVRVLHKTQSANIIISAYSLYELIQGMSQIEKIHNFRNKLISAGDFLVLNTDSVLEHRGLEYGLDCFL